MTGHGHIRKKIEGSGSEVRLVENLAIIKVYRVKISLSAVNFFSPTVYSMNQGVDI
jgi:hypothetical protein